MIQVISGRFRNLRLVTPKGQKTRPTTSQVRQAVFNICQNSLVGACFLDLCAGSAQMGIEAISRGATESTFIEKDPLAIKAIKENIHHLGIESETHLLVGDALLCLKKLEKQGKRFDICYFDPPYSRQDHQNSLVESVLTFLDTSSLLVPGGLLFLEESKYFTLEQIALQTLQLQNSRRFGDSYLYLFTR